MMFVDTAEQRLVCLCVSDRAATEPSRSFTVPGRGLYSTRALLKAPTSAFTNKNQFYGTMINGRLKTEASPGTI